MTIHTDRKTVAKDKMNIAIENLKLAEHEGALNLTPATHSWAKIKIYEDRKIILNPSSDEQTVEDAADDASAAAAQLLSSVRRHERYGVYEGQDNYSTPDLFEKEANEAINSLVNEGGPGT